MAARDAVALHPHPHEHVATKTFDQPQPLDRIAAIAAEIDLDRSVRQALKNLFDKLQALLDLADAHPDAGVDVASIEHRHVEIEPIIGRIARPLARIES